MVTGPMVRAARALLNWTQEDLARRASVTPQTVRLFESGGSRPYRTTLAEIQRAFENAGIVFLETDAGKGVLLKAPSD
jgi:transcriptional regulator with XRE-family HTH domain